MATFFTNKVVTIRQELDGSTPSPELSEALVALNEWRQVKTLHADKNTNSSPQQENLLQKDTNTFHNFRPTSLEEVKQIIQKMGPSSSILDPIPTNVIKNVLQILLPDITQIINKSLQSGIVPDAWKKGVVTPLLKKPNADQEDSKNFRPVTQLRLLARIAEAIATQQMQGHVEKHSFLHDQQSGFRPGRGTETATADIREKLLRCTDHNHPVVLVLLDLSAAFDTVDHHILLARLSELMGFNNTALAWVTSFLTNRVQQVKSGDVLSEEAQVPFGVPQGSALSPLLFNCYMRPLASLLEDCGLQFQMYADDTQVLVDLHESSEDSSKAIPCLTLTREWMRQNKLRLNEDKTELLLCGQSKVTRQVEIPWPRSWGPTPKPMTVTRDLGVMISHRLDGAAQAAQVTKACHHQLNGLVKLFPLLEVDQRVTIYHALVGSRLNYGLIFLLGATKKTLSSLQKVQNRAIRLIFNLKWREHISPWREQLKWLRIESLLAYKLCIWIWRARKKIGPRYTFHWAPPCHPLRKPRTQHTNKLAPSRCNKIRSGGATISSRGAKIWNTLPSHVRAVQTFVPFKKALKAHLLQTDALLRPNEQPKHQGRSATASSNPQKSYPAETIHEADPRHPLQLTTRKSQIPDQLIRGSRASSAQRQKSQSQDPTLQSLTHEGTSEASRNNPRKVWGVTSPPLPTRNNLDHIQKAAQNKQRNLRLGIY